VTNFSDPDFLLSILCDLTKFKFQLRKMVAPVIMVDSLELVCGSGYSHEKVAQAISAGWVAYPVHLNKHIYAKAALNIMEKMANSKPAATGGGPLQSRKRTWSASNDSGSSGTSGRSGAGRWNDSGYQRNEGFQRESRENSGGGGGASRVMDTVRPSTLGSTAAKNYCGNYCSSGGYDRRYY
jgi:hypothetical protein